MKNRFKTRNAFRSLLQQTFPNQEMHNHKKHFSLFLSIKQKNSPWKPEHWNRSYYNSSQTKNQMKKNSFQHHFENKEIWYTKNFLFFWKIQHRRHKKGSEKATTKQWKREKNYRYCTRKSQNNFPLRNKQCCVIVVGNSHWKNVAKYFFQWKFNSNWNVIAEI